MTKKARQRSYELSTAAMFGAQLLVWSWPAISAIPSSGTVRVVICPTAWHGWSADVASA